MTHLNVGTLAPFLIIFLAITAHEVGMATETRVIEITQTGCQFLQAEDTDLDFQPKQPEDCERINEETGDERLAAHQVLELSPGTYTFRVTNTDVPYELGFYLRAANKAVIPFSPRVSGGDLFMGDSQDYTVELTSGEYLYSCPYCRVPRCAGLASHAEWTQFTTHVLTSCPTVSPRSTGF
jgi:hypothetical protein